MTDGASDTAGKTGSRSDPPGPVTWLALGAEPPHIPAGLVLIGAALAAVPIFILSRWVHRYGINIPFSDQWELVPLIQRSHEAGLRLADVFGQHGEQRMLFPRLLMLGLAQLTDWNVRVEMFFNLLLAAGILGILGLLVAKTLRGFGAWMLVPAMSLSVLIFSPVQWENWLWGWSISWYLPLLCFLAAAGILAIWPDERPVWPALLIALTAAIIGQYSLFSGTLTWICTLPILLLRRDFKKHTVAWIGTGVVATAGYFYNLQPSHWEQFYASPRSLADEPQKAVRYILYYFSRPLAGQEPQFWPGGLFLLAFAGAAAYLLIFKRDRLQPAVVWLCIGSFSLLWGTLTMLGRLELGLSNAGASRYTTVSIIFMASTTTLVSLALAPPPGRRPSALQTAPMTCLWLALSALFIFNYPSQAVEMRQWSERQAEMKKCLQGASSEQDPCLTAVYPNGPAVFERAAYLKTIGWTGLANAKGRDDGSA